MDQFNNCQNFDKAVHSVSKDLRELLQNINQRIKNECTEVRLRLNLPVIIACKNKNLYLHNDSTVDDKNINLFICKKEIICDTFSRMCSYSLHAHLSDVVNGFVTLEGGHRAGVVGKAALDKDGNIISVHDITSINIRIARQVIGAANIIYNKLFYKGPTGLIIAGPPASGKTTVLRDLIRQISDSGHKVSVIDERQEIGNSAVNGCFDLGINTDVFSAYPKTKAIDIAVRTMSPEVIALDEVSKKEEIFAITSASNCGVKIIVTVHASSYDELLTKHQILSLITTYSFDKIVLMSGAADPGEIEGIFDVRELHDEILRCGVFVDKPFSSRV